MKSRFWSQMMFVLIALVVGSTVAIAQKTANTGPKYDTASEVKLKGSVEEIREVPGDFAGTQLVIKTETATVVVHVAPADFLKEMDTSFKKGDAVMVVAAKLPGAPEGEFLAREITVGTNTCTLRDDKGVPVWTPVKLGK